MKTNGKRKVVLLGVLAVLVCVYCIQIVFVGKTAVKVVSVKEEPDSLVIRAGSGSELSLLKDGDNWFVGDRKYPASASAVQELCEAIQSIKVLGTAARSANGEEERYGLDSESRIVVSAYKDGRKIQSVTVGKDTSTNRQSFVLMEADNCVYLADGALHSAFSVSVDDLRSKDVYSFDSSEIQSVSVARMQDGWKMCSFVRNVAASTENSVTDDSATNAEGVLSADNLSVGSWSAALVEPSMFGLSGDAEDLFAHVQGFPLDGDKISSWIRSLSSLTATRWLDEVVPFDGREGSFVVVIDRAGSVVTLRGCTVDDKMILACSETPYQFEVSSYVASRFEKMPSDFVADGNL